MIADPAAWQRTSPFAIVFFVGKTIKTLGQSFAQLLVTFGALAVLIRSNPYLFLLIPLGILAIIATGVFQYMFFRFAVQEDRILIRQGVLKKISLDLPLERIQGINVERSLVDRMLGLVTVSLDTAGSAAAEGQLPCVDTGLADVLRARVSAKHGSGDEDNACGEDDAEASTGPARRAVGGRSGQKGERREAILTLTTGDIVRIGLANHNLVLVGAVLGVLGQSLLFAEDMLAPAFESAETAFAGADDLAQTLLVTGFVATLLAIALGLVIGAAVLRHHNFTLWQEGATFRSRAGLLTQKEVVVEEAKIQQISVSQNPLMRLFGRYRLQALPAASLPTRTRDAGGLPSLAEVLEVPALKDFRAEGIRTRMFGREGDGLTVLPGSRGLARISAYFIPVLTLRISLVSALIGAVILFSILGSERALGVAVAVVIWWFCSLPPAALIAWLKWHRHGYLYTGEGLASRSGFLGRKVDSFLFRKVQSVAVRQSPLQRRKGLATLHAHLASGKVSVPFINHGMACRLRDRILYRVESSRLRWL